MANQSIAPTQSSHRYADARTTRCVAPASPALGERSHAPGPAFRACIAALSLACLVWHAPGAAQDTQTVYSDAQAGRGEALYQQFCVTCHGARLEGNPAAPLTGAAFRARWEDGKHTLDDLYFIIRSMMPNNAPGSLTKAQYADVVAYILKVNGYPAGQDELAPTAAVMKKLTLQPH